MTFSRNRLAAAPGRGAAAASLTLLDGGLRLRLVGPAWPRALPTGFVTRTITEEGS